MRYLVLAIFLLLAATALGQAVPTPAVVRLDGIRQFALEVDGQAYFPAVATFQGLGGSATYTPATQMLTVSLGGVTRRYLVSRGNRPTPDGYGFFIFQDTVYVPGWLLQNVFRLIVSWEPPTREVVVSNRDTAHFVFMPLRSLPPLRIPEQRIRPSRSAPRGSYPLFWASPDNVGMLLAGGLAGRRYVDGDAMNALDSNGLAVDLYNRTRRVGGSRIRARLRNNSVEITTDARLTGEVFALAAPWNAMPRRPEQDNPRQPIYQQMARNVLAIYGIYGVTPNVSEAFRCDLDGDGRSERIISATTPDRWYLENPAPGAYSFVAVQQNGRTTVVAGDFQPYDRPEDAWYNDYRIAGFLDVDGDRRLELLTGFTSYETFGLEVYRVTPDGAQRLFWVARP